MVKLDLRPDQLGVAAQNLRADRVEGAEPGHALDDLPDHLSDAQLHLARRLVGEGDGEDFARVGAAEVQDVGDAGGEHPRLAGAGAGQNKHRAVQRLHGEALFRVQIGKIGRGAGAKRARGDATRRARRRKSLVTGSFLGSAIAIRFS